MIISIGNLHGNQIPGKIYYAASTNKSILVTIDGDNKEEMKKYLESFNRFICCDNNKEAISEALNKLKNNRNVKYEIPSSLYPSSVAKSIIL